MGGGLLHTCTRVRERQQAGKDTSANHSSRWVESDIFIITLNIIYLNFNLITRFINFVRSCLQFNYSFECNFVSRQRKKDLISFYYIFTIFTFFIGVRISFLVYMKFSLFDFFALYFCRQWLYYFLLFYVFKMLMHFQLNLTCGRRQNAHN